MKNIDFDAFNDMAGALARARHIFVPHFTQNITLAFTLYQELLAEHHRPLRQNTLSAGHQPPSIIDELGRLDCFKCDTPMSLRILSNGKFKTQWECPRCNYKRRSKRTLNDWIDYLRKRFNKVATD